MVLLVTDGLFSFTTTNVTIPVTDKRDYSLMASNNYAEKVLT